VINKTDIIMNNGGTD